MNPHILRRVQSDIQIYGHSVIGVSGTEDRPSFSYTIGLTARYGVELLMIGLNPKYACMIMNQVADEGLAKMSITTDVPDARWGNMPLMFKEANQRAHEYVIQADQFYGKEVRVLQIVMPDRSGKFPHEKGFDSEYMSPLQPLLYSTATSSMLQ